MLPGVILPSDGLAGLGKFEKGTICSVCLKANRSVSLTALESPFDELLRETNLFLRN